MEKITGWVDEEMHEEGNARRGEGRIGRVIGRQRV
jgi:hypothetical protein